MNEENESEISENFENKENKEILEDILDNIFDENSSSDDDNNDDNDKEKDDIMQVDEEKLNKKIIEGLKLLHLKSLYNFTEAVYNNIIKLFSDKILAYIRLKKY